MNVKKILASAMLGAMIISIAPQIDNSVEAAKGGAKIAAPKTSAPATAPKVDLNKKPATNSTNESKSVSGNGKEYAPSKSAKDLQSTAPTSRTSSSTGWGNTLRNIGLFAGGMMLGGLIGSMFGGFGGFLGDILGLIFNVIMLFIAYKGIKFLYNKFKGNNNQQQNQYPNQNQYQAQNTNQSFNMMSNQNEYNDKVGTDYDPKRTADHYRNL